MGVRKRKASLTYLKRLVVAQARLPPLTAPSSGTKHELPQELASIGAFHPSFAAIKVGF